MAKAQQRSCQLAPRSPTQGTLFLHVVTYSNGPSTYARKEVTMQFQEFFHAILSPPCVTCSTGGRLAEHPPSHLHITSCLPIKIMRLLQWTTVMKNTNIMTISGQYMFLQFLLDGCFVLFIIQAIGSNQLGPPILIYKQIFF